MTKKDKKSKQEERKSIIERLIGSILSDEDSTDLKKLKRLLDMDVREAAKLMSVKDARYLVETYYDLQKFRIAMEGQIRSVISDDISPDLEQPKGLTVYVCAQIKLLENQVKNSLGAYAAEFCVGKWLQSICGVGPVLSAGFLTTFDIRRHLLEVKDLETGNVSIHPESRVVRDKIKKGKLELISEKYEPRHTAGAFWKFAGLDPTVKWEKGKIRPWNARAKVLCFKLGESFVKVQNNDSDIYGKLLIKRKQLELEKNELGDFTDQAAAKLEAFKIGKNTDAYRAYSDGKLPPAHIHSRARRWVVKLFLSHLHHQMYLDYFEKTPPVPFVFSECFNGGVHTHYIQPTELPKTGKSLAELYNQSL